MDVTLLREVGSCVDSCTDCFLEAVVDASEGLAFDADSLLSVSLLGVGVSLEDDDCRVSSDNVSSDRDTIYSNNDVLTRFAACRTWSEPLDIAGSTWVKRRGTNGSMSSGLISKKLSIHRSAVNCISSSIGGKSGTIKWNHARNFSP